MGARDLEALLTIAAIGLAWLGLSAWVVIAERAIFEGPLDLADLAAYEVATLALIGLYVWVLVLASRGRLSGRSRTLAVAFPVAFHLLLLPVRPYLSLDLFTYIAHGAQAVLLGTSPYAAAAGDVASTPLGLDLVAAGWRSTVPVTPYGPLWTAVEIGAVSLVRDAAGAMLVLKAVVVAASLGSAALIWAILGRVRPADQLLGTLAYLWSPLIVFELAGEGHNDAVMTLFVLAALYAAVLSQRGQALVAMALAALAKILPLVFAPALAAWLWRDPRERAARLRGVAAGLAVAALVTVALLAPFWIGTATFSGVGASVETGRHFASLRQALTGLLGGLIPDVAIGAALAAIFVALALAASARVTSARSLLTACAWISLAYVLVASPYFWPWHAALPIALMALAPEGAFRWGLVALAAGARMVAPLDDIFAHGFISLTNARTLTFWIAIAMPLLALSIAQIRSRPAAL